jgi:rhodanese-related sulfurtransferase
MGHRSVDDLLTEARAGLDRVSPARAADAMRRGAVVVDIRPVELRRRDGVVPGAIVIDRNVLEWRLDPQCEYRIPEIARREHRIIVLCNEGYQSSLAAATLQQLGLDATDVDGGFQAWRAAGLPTTPEPDPDPAP